MATLSRLTLLSWLVPLTLVACSDAARDPTGVVPSFHRNDDGEDRAVPVVAEINRATVVDPGDIRTLPDGSTRIRRQRLQGPISGDLASTAVDAVHILIEKATIDRGGNGPFKGRFSITACHRDLGCGTFEGRLKGRNTALIFSGEFKARGTSGDFDEMRFSGTFAERPGMPTNRIVITGTIRVDEEDDEDNHEGR